MLVRFELPILGELLAGVLIGASNITFWCRKQVQLSGAFRVVSGLSHVPVEEIQPFGKGFGALQAVATLGLYSLLFLTGLGELEELMAVGAQAFGVAIVGVVLPFALGTLGLMAIFHVDAIPAIFAGAMTATSIGITASVFGELGYLRARGQIVIGAVLDASSASSSWPSWCPWRPAAPGIGPIVQLVVAAVLFVVVALLSQAAPAFDWVIDQLKAQAPS